MHRVRYLQRHPTPRASGLVMTRSQELWAALLQADSLTYCIASLNYPGNFISKEEKGQLFIVNPCWILVIPPLPSRVHMLEI